MSQAWESRFSIELARSVGSVSFEDHYFCSGWQVATVLFAAGLKPEESIIEIGCGVGRLAYGLCGSHKGGYLGIDVTAPSVEFCRRRMPELSWAHLDLRSQMYNPTGRLEPERLVLPAADQSFDVAVLFSVFTHLLPQTFRRMTSEVGRVLRPRGRCLATFLITDNQGPNAAFRLPGRVTDSCRVEIPENPEAAVGYRKDWVLSTFAEAGMHLARFDHGNWTGENRLGTQDQIVFLKSLGGGA